MNGFEEVVIYVWGHMECFDKGMPERVTNGRPFLPKARMNRMLNVRSAQYFQVKVLANDERELLEGAIRVKMEPIVPGSSFWDVSVHSQKVNEMDWPESVLGNMSVP